MKHTCHANGCTKPCAPEKLMCSSHWKQVPEHLQKDVYKHYTPGQCRNMNLLKVEWLRAARRAINSVAGLPYDNIPY